MEFEPRPSKLSSITDAALMRRVCSSDEDALEALIGRHWNALVEYSMGFLEQVDAAEDVVQECFLRVWESRHGWTDSGSIRGYLYTVARNLSLHERDRRAVRDKWVAKEKFSVRFSPAPSEVLQEQVVFDALREAIEGLPARRREVFTLACLHGLSYREVADAMGIAIPTVANQMSSALDELREALRTLSDHAI